MYLQQITQDAYWTIAFKFIGSILTALSIHFKHSFFSSFKKQTTRKFILKTLQLMTISV